MGLADQDFHQRQVAEEGDGAVGEMEAHKPSQRVAPRGRTGFRHGSAQPAFVRPRPVDPGELFMPDEVVQHCGLDGERGGSEIVEVQHTLQQKQRCELHGDPNPTDEVELAPAPESGGEDLLARFFPVLWSVAAAQFHFIGDASHGGVICGRISDAEHGVNSFQSGPRLRLVRPESAAQSETAAWV
jgi:hypothetical protein